MFTRNITGFKIGLVRRNEDFSNHDFGRATGIFLYLWQFTLCETILHHTITYKRPDGHI